MFNEFDIDFEVKKLKEKRELEDNYKLEEDKINYEYKVKCDAIDNRIKELKSLKKGLIWQQYKQQLLDLRTKYKKI